jgi:hypothetical protein
VDVVAPKHAEPCHERVTRERVTREVETFEHILQSGSGD